MFPSGRVFIAECKAVQECLDASMDVALLVLKQELDLDSSSNVHGNADAEWCNLPAADIADEAVSSGSQLFCIGNPSNVDLESQERED